MRQSAVFDRASLTANLKEGVAELALDLQDEQFEQMMDYLGLLFKWNSVYNLTSIRDPQEMVKQHLLDSLAAVFAFAHAKNILDVGSGGGLPGLVLAIVYPQARVTMIDIVHKKTAFLTQVKAELGLKNVSIHTGRVEQYQVDTLFDVITSRAFSELANFINWSGHLLQEGGQFIALKGVRPDGEIECLPEGWKLEQIKAIKVPMLTVERHLVCVNKK